MLFKEYTPRHLKRIQHPFYGNQYSFRKSTKQQSNNPVITYTKLSLVSMTMSLAILWKLSISYGWMTTPLVSPLGTAHAQIARHESNPKTALLTPTGTTVPLPMEMPVKSPNSASEQANEDYVRTIFGKDAKVAIAISHAECNPANKTYPACVAHSDIEYSIGMFQINLKNKTQMVHFYRVPGNTLEEKIEWLKNPQNNTLFAYWIFQHSGFNPWSTYLNGAYLQNM